MDICLLSHDFLPNPGGIANHVNELSKSLIRKNNNVHIVCSTKHIFSTREKNTYRFFYPRIPALGTIVAFPTEFALLNRIIKSDSFDIIHSHNLLPDSATMLSLSNIPKVITEHSSGFLQTVDNKYYAKIYKKIFSQANQIIGPSQEIVNKIINLGFDGDRVHYIPNGVDTEVFHRTEKNTSIQKSLKIKDEDFVIICARRLVNKNGVKFLLEAMPKVISKHNNVKLVIIGDGPEYNYLQNITLINNTSGHIIFTGNIKNIDMPKYYSIGNIAVLPSLYEATSIAGLEAMACELPLIGTDVGGIPQIIENGKTGLIVKSQSSDEISSAIIDIIENPNLAEYMGHESFLRIHKEFSWDFISACIENVYKKAIKNNN